MTPTEKHIDALMEKIKKLKSENARYREALEVYADDDVIGTVARKALKGE